MRNLTLFTTLSCFGVLATVGHAQGTMYGIDNGTGAANIYTIDTSTGAATTVATATIRASFSGLEYMNGLLYATDLFDGNDFGFGSIDPTTGATTFIATQGSSNMWGLAANHSLGLFYTIDFDSGNVLKTIDVNGNFTTIGSTGVQFNGTGMAYDDNSGTLYATAFDANLYSIDTTTGAASLIGATGLTFGNAWQGLAFNSDNNTLYMNSADTDSLYSLSTVTGAATLIGSNGAVAGHGIDGLAYAPVPEPATMACLGLGVAALLRRRKKS